LAEAAIALHHAYGAVEAALSRIARSVDAGFRHFLATLMRSTLRVLA
jgi:hypothetical protein